MSDAAPPPQENEAGPLDVSPRLIAEIVAYVGERDPISLRSLLDDLHPADAADALELTPPSVFETALPLLGAAFPPRILVEFSESHLGYALEHLPDGAVLKALDEADSDDAALLMNALEEGRRADILNKIKASDRASLESALAFDEETAGRLMQREFVAAPHFWSVGDAIDHMRRNAEALPDEFFDIYIIDPKFKLTGAVALHKLLCAPRETRLADIRRDLDITIPPEMDQEEVARLFQKYHLASAPVVNADGRLTGMITVDDMVDVIQAESDEDLLALAGVNDAGAADDWWDTVKARAPWLAVNVVTAFMAASVIAFFEGTIEQIVALAVLMPVVAALGGNAGAQALAVAVSGLASRDLTDANAMRAVGREGAAALVNGLVFGAAVAAVAGVWFGDWKLAAVLGSAMLLTFVWAGLMGILVPLGLKKVGADPAVASSVFVLTAVDLAGFFAFLGLATLILL